MSYLLSVNTPDLRTLFLCHCDSKALFTGHSAPWGVNRLTWICSHSLSTHHYLQATRLPSVLTDQGVLPAAQIWVPFFSTTVRSCRHDILQTVPILEAHPSISAQSHLSLHSLVPHVRQKTAASFSASLMIFNWIPMADGKTFNTIA